MKYETYKKKYLAGTNKCSNEMPDLSKLKTLIIDHQNPEVIKEWGEIGDWNISKIISLEKAFECLGVGITITCVLNWCRLFNTDISNWDVSNVENSDSVFEDCWEFNKPLNYWDVSKGRTFNKTLYNCKNFNQPLDKLDVSTSVNMALMFYNCNKFNQSLNYWDVGKDASSVRGFGQMFENCKKFSRWIVIFIRMYVIHLQIINV